MRVALLISARLTKLYRMFCPNWARSNQPTSALFRHIRAQTTRMKASVGSKEIEIDTVHKYQGREKRVMIITTVSNEANEFVDNPNLLNVAVSRAQEKLRLVVSKEMAEGNGNIADFVRYIRYNNCEVIPGKVRSIFDLLYGDYTAARLEVLKKRKRVSTIRFREPRPRRNRGSTSRESLSVDSVSFSNSRCQC